MASLGIKKDRWIDSLFLAMVLIGRNPFGYSGRRIGDIYSGIQKDMYVANDWKKFRRTSHSHNPVDDAKGNAEALLHFKNLGLKL